MYIDTGAFAGMNIRSISIPDSVTRIGHNAFNECKSLTDITIGSGVTSIGNNAFRCTSLRSIVLPNKVQQTGESIFRDCSSLFSVKLPDTLSKIANYTFWGCKSLDSIEIPEGVIEIGSNEFKGCSALTTIRLPSTLRNISEYTIENLHQLKNLTGIFVDSNNPDYSSDQYGVLYDRDKTSLIIAPAKISPQYVVPKTVRYIRFDADKKRLRTHTSLIKKIKKLF